jgi:hypothetical protein
LLNNADFTQKASRAARRIAAAADLSDRMAPDYFSLRNSWVF